MKTTYFFLLTMLMGAFATRQAEAKIWRVNNTAIGPYGANVGGNVNFPVFKQPGDANLSNLVNNGDTLHIEGSADVYATAIITKRLTIIGPGFFLSENPAVANTVLDARIQRIDFNLGSAGSQLIGMHIIRGLLNEGINISVSNILIKRCKLSNEIDIISGQSGITISQNFFDKEQSTLNIISNDLLISYVAPKNLIFNNNICQRTLVLRADYTFLECKNNVFDCPAIANQPSIQLTTNSFQNNILKTTGALVNINNNSNLNVSHNISASAAGQFGTANNNIVVTDFTTLFVDPATNTTDGDYQLKPNSPGSSNGSDGADRGAFGGLSVASRYTLSGVAPIPVIYEINTSGVAGPNGMNVSIKARTIK